MVSVIRPIGTAPTALVMLTTGLLLVHASSDILSGASTTILACAIILILGLPHGTLDLKLMRQTSQAAGISALSILCFYLTAAFSMWALWMVMPVTALCLFLAVAAYHFSEDWQDTGSPFLSIAVSVAILCAPALFNLAALQEIFTALTGTPDSQGVVDVMRLLAPISLTTALVAVGVLVRARHYPTAIAASCSLAAMLFLPPAVGFVVFFGLYHSPRHFSDALASLAADSASRLLPTVVSLTALSLMLALILFMLSDGGSIPMRFASATFMCLSILTVPHMIVPWAIAAAGRSHSAAAAE